LWDELMQANGLGYIFVDEDKHDDGIDPTNYRLLIAQRAYDLVYHSVDETGVAGYEGLHTVAEIVKDIPDLTEWPVEEGEKSEH
jgi:hypothetical protein